MGFTVIATNKWIIAALPTICALCTGITHVERLSLRLAFEKDVTRPAAVSFLPHTARFLNSSHLREERGRVGKCYCAICAWSSKDYPSYRGDSRCRSCRIRPRIGIDAAHNSTDVGFFSVVTVVEHVIMRVVEGDHAFLTCTSGISVSRSLASVYWTQRNIETYL